MIVVIPIYKTVPSHYEEISFLQCLKVLKHREIAIVTHKNLNIDYYLSILEELSITYRVEYFDSLYFTNITGYNFLMLSKDFYHRFVDNDYILIYQLDCFVFEDTLDYWMSKGYDYIGSPFFAHYGDYSKATPFWYNGNGGLSLRKINAFLKVLNFQKPLFKSRDIKLNLKQAKFSFVKYYVSYFLQLLGCHNNVRFYLKAQGYDFGRIKDALEDDVVRANEDSIWAKSFKYTRVRIIAPDFEGGLGFAFERSPSYLYEQNGNQLPFGCHAWAKYELNFWKPFIEKFGYKL